MTDRTDRDLGMNRRITRSTVKIRLNRTAVRVKHGGDATAAKEAEVAYARGGKVYTAKGRNCILAGWHVVIPYL
ncbi:MAG: hypothetical protein WB762_33085 [Candidatus Sulfotelmatobacter sp.]